MPLKAKAVQNTNIVKRNGKQETKVKQGLPVNHSEKHTTLPSSAAVENRRIVGVNIGTTINMGDYESLRVDCWLTDFVGEKETYEKAFARVTEIATKQVEETVTSLKS